jgi:hypothetical protein
MKSAEAPPSLCKTVSEISKERVWTSAPSCFFEFQTGWNQLISHKVKFIVFCMSLTVTRAKQFVEDRIEWVGHGYGY